MFLEKEVMIMEKMEIDNVEASLEKTINKDGRIWGLKKWSDRKAIIIIPKEIGNEKSESVGSDIIE